MRQWELLIHAPISEALGWTVLHSLWEGAAIALALAVVLACTRSARVRYGAAYAALLALVCCFGATFALALPTGGAPHLGPVPVFLVAWRGLRGVSLAARSVSPWVACVPWIAPTWICGVCVFYCWCAAGWLWSRRLRNRGAYRAPVYWQSVLARLAAELAISRPVTLLESVWAETPVVFGHIRPVIFVPLGFLAGLAPDQVEAILLHELAHILRSDYLINLCQRFLLGLLFYHPAAWWIAHVICREREHCSDDIVVECGRDPRRYAIALTELERSRLASWQPHPAMVAATGGHLMKRVKRLLYPKGPSGVWAPIMATVVLTVSSAGLMAAWRVDSAAPAPVSRQASDHASPSSWQQWLNEDVVYIITDQERAAFQRLTTDAERQRSVEQFWERRDPTPDTAANEFKDEHYRRIAFANAHFHTTSGTPGWQTDRGHIYILYGPPDEIDAHPKGSQNTYGVQSWKYQHVPDAGDNQYFTFFDRSGDGDYRLGPANSPGKGTA